jgi:hypothetical protein
MRSLGELPSNCLLPIGYVAELNLPSQPSFATEGGVVRLKELHDREHRQEYQDILNWLTPIDYAPLQSDLTSKRQEGTGQWLLSSVMFSDWVNQSKRTLFCPGIPGAGKTIITSIVVEYLWAEFQNDANIGIAYVYCNYRQKQEQRPVDILESLLKQLVQAQPSMPESVKSLYKRHKDKRTRPSLDEITNVLYSVVANYSRVFIVIDALDECQASNGSRRRLLSEIFGLQDKTGTNLFATSRFLPEIMKEFERSMTLEIRATDNDVLRYLDGHMSQLPSYISRSYALQEEIKTTIVKAVDGMCVPLYAI